MHPAGPLLVVAGAGSGKTRVITYRLARLVAAGADPRRILAVTFTNKAAGELRERVDELLWDRMGIGTRGLWVGTFHATSARILRQWGETVGLRKDFVIFDDDDQKRLLGARAHRPEGPRADVPRAAGAVGDRSRQEPGRRPRRLVANDYLDDVVGKAYRLYEERLAAANATDFGGLLLSVLRLAAGGTPAAEELGGASITCWSTSSRTPTASSTGWCGCCRGARATSPSSATRTSRSTAGAAPTSATSSTSRATTRARASSSWSATTARPATSWRAANAIIERNSERRPKRCSPRRGTASASSVRGRDRARRGRVRRRPHRRRAVGDAGAARLRGLLPHQRPVARAGRCAARAQPALRGRRRHALLRPRRDQGPGRLHARRRQPRRRHGAAADHQRPGARHRRHRPSIASARSSTSARLRPWEVLELVARDDQDAGHRAAQEGGRVRRADDGLRAEGAGAGPASLAEKILEETGYRDALAAEATMEAEGRIENLLEFVGQIGIRTRGRGADADGFLERIALASDVDGYDPKRARSR